MIRPRTTFILIVFIFSVVSSAHSQTPPPGESPEAMGSRYQAEMEKEKKALGKAKPSKIEVKKEAEAPVPEGPSFTLKELTVTGATVFTPEDLKSMYASYIGKTVSFKDLEAVAKSI